MEMIQLKNLPTGPEGAGKKGAEEKVTGASTGESTWTQRRGTRRSARPPAAPSHGQELQEIRQGGPSHHHTECELLATDLESLSVSAETQSPVPRSWCRNSIVWEKSKSQKPAARQETSQKDATKA